MNNIQRIDDFLKFWSKIVSQNPYFSTNIEDFHKQIYSKLIRLGVKEEDHSVVLSSDVEECAFDYWTKYYQNNPKINVFNSANWPYFCQFSARDNKAKTSKEHIKIYIPLDSKHIQKGATLIFNFLTENNISHESKIGKQIRFDDIVVRLIKEEDAKKLLDFVENNSYLQSGLIKPNPFAFQEKGIALACDGRDSYNETVAYLIAMYIDDCKKNNTLNTVNYKNFYYYISNNYNKEFIQKIDNPFQKVFGYDEIDKKENYQRIIALILKSQSKDFHLDNYFSHFRNSLKNKTSGEKDENCVITLIDAMKTMSQKYGYENAINQMQAYLSSNNPLFLTRDNNIRTKVATSNLREIFFTEMESKNIPFKELYTKLLNTLKKKNLIFDKHILDALNSLNNHNEKASFR